MDSTRWSRYLHEPFIYAALAIALTAGFGYGTILVAANTLGVRLDVWYGALVQAHGHAQLFGWVGLFVLGMGLVFLPRLRGTTLQATDRVPYAFGLLVFGIVLRSVIQPLAGILGTNELLRALFLLSAFSEAAGILVIFSMLAKTGLVASKTFRERRSKPLSHDAPAYPVEPFAQMALLSLALAFLANLLGVWYLFSQGKNILPAHYDQLIINLILYGVSVPMAFVFAIRALPLFLRLVSPTRGGWRTLALIYFTGLTLRLAPNALSIADDALILTGRVLRANFVNLLIFDALAVFGILLLNLCILVGIWRLNLLHRRGPLPDRGEYGRFHLLIYSAYVWLVVAVVLDMLRSLPVVNEQLSIPQDSARHALMLGFITLLIFGMSVRMVPGFSHKRRLARPELVFWLFILGNLAALLRVAPLFFPDARWTASLLGISGIVGWSAVLLLAFILWKTFHAK